MGIIIRFVTNAEAYIVSIEESQCGDCLVKICLPCEGEVGEEEEKKEEEEEEGETSGREFYEVVCLAKWRFFVFLTLYFLRRFSLLSLPFPSSALSK